MAGFTIRPAIGAPDLTTIRMLMQEYADYLGANPSGAANICIAGYQAELDALPGVYGPPGGALLLAVGEPDGDPLGCCALKPFPIKSGQPDGEGACEMKRLWVRPTARGLGLGRSLVLATLEHAGRLGYTSLYLDTAPAAMPEAQRLYIALGFERVERYNDNPVPGVVFFRRRLG